jgi:hypothetical protein
MIGSGEAEFRAVAEAVKSAISQTRLDAGVNITGLLVDIDSTDSSDYRQHFMCWHLTRVFRPSLTEKVPPAVVRSVVDQETTLSHIVSSTGSPWDANASRARDGQRRGWHGRRQCWCRTTAPTMDSGKVRYRGDGYLRDRVVLGWFGDGMRASLHQELRARSRLGVRHLQKKPWKEE